VTAVAGREQRGLVDLEDDLLGVADYPHARLYRSGARVCSVPPIDCACCYCHTLLCHLCYQQILYFQVQLTFTSPTVHERAFLFFSSATTSPASSSSLLLNVHTEAQLKHTQQPHSSLLLLLLLLLLFTTLSLL
jgi:hypothetical protein